MMELYALLMSIIFSLFPNQDVDCIEWNDYEITQCYDSDYVYEQEEIEIPNEYYWEFPYEEMEG